MGLFGERAGKRRGKKATALLVPLPAAVGWKLRSSPAVSEKERKVSAATPGRIKQQ